MRILIVCLLILLSNGSLCAQSPAKGAIPIIDTHAHLSFDDEERDFNEKVPASETELLKQMASAGVQRAGIITIARKGELERTRKNNDRLIAIAKANPERFFPICSVHPDDGAAAIAELERIAKLGVKGIKLHPNTQ